MAQMFGQPLVVWAAKAPVQQAVQLGLQAPGGHRQTMWGNLTLLVAITQPEAVLQQHFHRHRELGSRWGYLDHLPTPPDQMLQAALMQGLRKPVETPRSVMQQKPGVVCSQNCRGLCRSALCNC